MKRRILILGLALVLLVILVIPVTVFAAETGEVTATVTGSLVSVTVTDGTVEYGVLALNATENTTASGVNDTQTATNDGTVTATFNIKSSNAEDVVASDNWTLAAAAGADAFTHTASIDSGVNWDKAMTTYDSYVELATGIAAEGTQDFDLRIEMPITVTDYTEHTITVTIQAVEE